MKKGELKGKKLPRTTDTRQKQRRSRSQTGGPSKTRSLKEYKYYWKRRKKRKKSTNKDIKERGRKTKKRYNQTINSTRVNNPCRAYQELTSPRELRIKKGNFEEF